MNLTINKRYACPKDKGELSNETVDMQRNV